MKIRNGYLDLFKLIMSYLVIAIHFSYHPITRIAVPFFFMLSGFFSYNNSSNDYKNEKEKKRILKSLKYLIMGLLLYFVYDLVMLFINHGSLMWYIKGLIYPNPLIDNLILHKNVTSGYHLWFIFALVTVNIIHYFIVRFNKTTVYKYICIPLLIINLIISVYLTNSPVGRVWDIEYTRNAILFGLPLFGLGYLISTLNLDKIKKYNWIVFVIALIFMLLQTYENKLYLKLFDLEAEFFVTTIIGSICFLIFFKNLKYNGSWLYKLVDNKMSFFVYIVHLMIGNLLSKYYNIKGLTLTLLTILISTLLYYIVKYLIIMMKIVFEKIDAKIKKKRGI